MKKYYSILFSLLAIVGLAACSSDDNVAEELPTGSEVFFPISNPSSYTLNMGDGIQTLEVTIARANSSEAATIDLQTTVAKNADAFSIPTQVTFAANEAEAVIPVSYDATALGYDNPDTLSICIGKESETTPYGIHQYEFVVNIPSPFKLIGTGNFTENYWYGGANKVEIYQNEVEPNVFRVMNPFNEMTQGEADGTQSPYAEITILKAGETFRNVTVTRDDLVFFSTMNTGYLHPSYGAYVYLYHPSSFASLQKEEAWVCNRVIEWQENGLPGRIQLAPYYYMTGVGGWNKSTEDDIAFIDFPGYEPKDYALEVTYTGKFINVADEYFASFALTMGADVEEVKYALAPSANVDATIDGIAEGSINAYSTTTDGTYQVPVAESGRYAIVAVAFAGGKAVGATSTSFKFEVGAPEVWNALGLGLYTEDALCALYKAPAVTYEVEIEESQDRPGVYRLVNAYGENFPYNDPGDWDDSRNYYIEINAQDPEAVFIEQQSTGLDWGDGEFSIQSLASFYIDNGEDFDAVKAAGLFGTLTDGVITFPAKGLLGTLGSDGPYSTNTAGDTKIVLPGAVSATARAAKNSKAGHRQYKLGNNQKVQKSRWQPLSKEHISPTLSPR